MACYSSYNKNIKLQKPFGYDKIGGEFMKWSKNWVVWKTNVGTRTCINCLLRNQKIFPLDELVAKNEPPIHPNCKCERKLMQAIIAGNATFLGTNGADWSLKYLQELPEYYITREEAREAGWIEKKGNLADVAPGTTLFGGIFRNKKGILPQKEGRIWYEADINYIGGYRSNERIVFSNDGLVFVTRNHYETFVEVIGGED